MAHGDVSDLVFFAFLGMTIQLWGLPDTLYKDIGPLKAQFSTHSAELDACAKVCGGLVLTLGMMFSGVKWNPKNGIMGGAGMFIVATTTAYTQFKADPAPHFFYLYAAIFLLGGLHLFIFRSNPALPKVKNMTNNNHGNFSDLIFFALFGCSMLCFFYEDHLFRDFGPIKAQFHAKSSDLTMMIKLYAGVMMVLAMLFSGVKWDPVNGKMAGIGGFISSAVIAYSAFKSHEQKFVPCIFYVYAVTLFLGSLHIFAFPSNPLASEVIKRAEEEEIKTNQ